MGFRLDCFTMLLESIWACELTLRVPYVAEIRALVDADLDRGAQIYRRIRRMRRKCVCKF